MGHILARTSILPKVKKGKKSQNLDILGNTEILARACPINMAHMITLTLLLLMSITVVCCVLSEL